MNEDLTLDERRIRAMIKQAEMRSKLYKKSYNYEADWLVVGSIGSEQWIISFPDTPELSTFDFRRKMPDGSYLTDESNHLLLRTIQKWLFHCRMGNITGKSTAHRRWEYCFWLTINLSTRVILFKHIYNPEDYGFMLFDMDAFKSLADDLSKGSWTTALLFKERFLDHLLSVLPNIPDLTRETIISDPSNLPGIFVNAAIDYFNKNELYVSRWQGSVKHTGAVSLEYVGSVLGVHSATLNHISFRLFIRQFEPNLAHDALFQSKVRRNFHHSQNTHTTEDVSFRLEGLKTFKASMSMLSIFFGSSLRLPDEIPTIKINVKEFLTEYSSQLRQPGHTKLIPMEIGFQCLNQASRWVLIYGKSIVQSLTFYTQRFSDIDNCDHSITVAHKMKINLFNQTKHRWMTEAVEGLPAQPLDQALNITRLRARRRHGNPLNESNFESIVSSFIGACAIVIGMLKPIRSSELGNLYRNCLYYDKNFGGAFLRHSARKTGRLGINSEIDRPIPYLAAYTIQLLQILGNQLSETFDDKSEHSDHLFYFPSRSFKRPGSKRNEFKVDSCIDMFCDAIEIPIDKLNRRWYVRVHEMRKFFLLIVHRHEGDAVKDMLRYLAGHANPSHLDDYIAHHPSDAEAIRYESECIDDKLIALEKGEIPQEDNQGLVALYTQTLTQFGVTSISTINKTELLRYLDNVSSQPDFDIASYTVRLEDYNNEIHAIDFAIKMGRKADAKYNK